MKPKHKRILVLIGLTLLGLHFTLLSVYIFKPGKLSVLYVYPYFHQNWNVFVPPPQANYNLYALFDGKRIDVFAELNQRHQNNRFSGNEPLLLGLINCIHYFESEQNPVTNGANFKMIERFTKHYLQQTRHLKIKQLRLILLVSKPNNPALVYYN
ncbi:MAG: hypothetical protein JWO32_40 [Bacteroidetes bacterium]|nr:hypothetical protein [Bacteroidota bacterium]